MIVPYMPLICTKHDSRRQGNNTEQAKCIAFSWNLPGCQDIQVSIQIQYDVVSITIKLNFIIRWIKGICAENMMSISFPIFEHSRSDHVK